MACAWTACACTWRACIGVGFRQGPGMISKCSCLHQLCGMQLCHAPCFPLRPHLNSCPSLSIKSSLLLLLLELERCASRSLKNLLSPAFSVLSVVICWTPPTLILTSELSTV
jgi:hypothetical protein